MLRPDLRGGIGLTITPCALSQKPTCRCYGNRGAEAILVVAGQHGVVRCLPTR